VSHVHHTASVAATALVTGDVTIGAGSRVLSGAVLNGDLGPVRLGEDVVVMEHALLRGRPDHPVEIGDAVLVGPHTHLNGTTVEDEVFIATGVSMFPGSVAGDPGTLYGVPRGTSMREIMRRQSAVFRPR
jgi:carbonic anhydrase/acetyltransferase-like protein (isoleucine patch superfamily)